MALPLDKIIEAVVLVNDANTSNEERMKYTQAVEALKAGDAGGLASAGFALIARNDPLLSHIGWTFLEEIIRFKWNELPGESRLELRNRILQALEAGPMQSTIECLARCVVAMMEHEWPQNWVELVPQLDQLSQIGSLHCTTVFSILRRLVENVITLASVSCGQRRKDMYNAILLYMPEMIKLALDRLESTKSDDTSTLAVKHVIGWLAEICEWVPSTTLESHLHRLVSAVARHLNTADRNIYEHAARCLAALAVRKKEKQEEAHVVNAFFRSEIISTILSTTSMAAEVAQSNEQHYNYLKALCQLLSALGNQLAKVWTEKTSPPNFDSYLSAIIAFFNHPSLHLRMEACDVLVSLVQHSSLEDDSSLRQAISAVLDRVPQVMEKVGYPSESPLTASGHYSQMDYDDDLEWSNMFLKFREKVRILVTSSLPRHLPQLLRIFDQWVYQRALSQPQQVPQREWDPMQKFAKFVIQQGFEQNLIDENTRDTLTSMGDALVDSMNNLNDWDLLSEVLSVHSALLHTLNNHPTGLYKYLALLQRCLSCSGGHKTLNRHCISHILRAVMTNPEFFKANAPLVVKLCQTVQSSVSPMQLAQLLQVLAALSNVVETEEDKVNLLRMSVAPALEYLVEHTSSFESVGAFISLNGFDANPPGSFEEGETRADIGHRKELRRNLTALEGVLHQVSDSSPLGPVLSSIFPVIFKLSSVVNELSTERARSLCHSVYQSICDMTLAEKQQIYCSVGESMEAQTGQSAVDKATQDSDCAADRARQYNSSLNDNCINIISLCATKFGDTLFSHQSILSMLEGTTANLSDVPSFRIKCWVRKAWRSLILSCPSDKRHCIIPLFTAITSHMQDRLESLWNQVATIDYDAEPTEAELLNEHMTCVLSREYLQLLRAVYLVNEVNLSNSDDKRASLMSPLGEWLFQEKVGLSVVLKTVFDSLNWRDTQSSLKAIPVCRAFADKLAFCYDDQAAVFIFISAIQALQMHGADEVAGAPLIGLVFHIYITLRKLSDSLPQVLQQVPETTTESIELFDKKVLALIDGSETLTDKHRREMTKKLLRGVISQTTGELHRRPVYLRPLPPIEKRRKEPSPETDFVGLAALFAET